MKATLGFWTPFMETSNYGCTPSLCFCKLHLILKNNQWKLGPAPEQFTCAISLLKGFVSNPFNFLKRTDGEVTVLYFNRGMPAWRARDPS